jgi:phosphotransferase system HPr (HPr) family protein
MKLLLPDALHARPANLLVRLAAQHHAVVEVRKGTCRADARKILDVLSLGAAKGDEIELFAEGDGADAALAAIAELIGRNFDADLVPETGSAAVEGIAIGVALVVTATERPPRTRGTPNEERARLHAAEMRAIAELDALMAGLAPDERALFEPETAIVHEVAESARARLDGGEASEDAVVALTAGAATDLLIDARARLIDALSDDDPMREAIARAAEIGEDIVLVVEVLTPSLVASLPPHVRGIVAIDDEAGATDATDANEKRARTSHAAILARGREIPLAMVPAHVALAIAEGDSVVVDTTLASARVWVSPSEALVTDARARRENHAKANRGDVARAIDRVLQTLGVSLLVNVGSLHDRVPEGAAGVGLLRTELLFAGRTSAPSENDQCAALLAVARAAKGNVVTARLWDAGGDKPLAWLASSDPDARGAALLFAHPAILYTQLAAIARAASLSNVRALIPMVRGASDVHAVRERMPKVKIGAMIETPRAAEDADAIADAADFVCIGTNDLASLVLGVARSDAGQALDRRVLAIVASVVERVHARGKRVTICGEVAADERGARILVGLGVDALSVASPRIGAAASVLDGATRDDCRAAARAALAT